MAKVIREFLASKFWDATTIAGDSVNEEHFRCLAAAYVRYCKEKRITFKTKVLCLKFQSFKNEISNSVPKIRYLKI